MDHPAPQGPAEALEIMAGLTASPAMISPKYFYDQKGSELFDAITRLSEYYPTRTEMAIMQAHGHAIAAAIGPDASLIELGAGNCAKARRLCHAIHPARFIGVDISADYLREGVKHLQADFPALEVHAVAGDVSHTIALPPGIPRARRLVYYPGSSIGNFDRVQALALLQRMRALVDGDGGLLIGIDLPKDLDVLEPAYDDAAGVTAAFNRNVLDHLNARIASNFDIAHWDHVAFFNAVESRIEMHLQANRDTQVQWPGGGRRFAAGERIHTENSYKYPLQEFIGLLARGGFSRAQAWTDPLQWFAVVHARP